MLDNADCSTLQIYNLLSEQLYGCMIGLEAVFIVLEELGYPAVTHE